MTTGPLPAPHIVELVSRRLLTRQSDDQYSFRHALTHDAVYGTLLRAERRALHEAAGQAIEALYAGQLESHLGDLAYHYYQAEAWERALDYARQAGDQAQAAYALREAIDHYTRAVDAAHNMERHPSLPALHRARGQSYDICGDFEQARLDHEAALALARDGGDQGAEWQALVDLGELWASRDYQRTGIYLQQALKLARARGDRAGLGQTLNRLGNWHLNLLEMEASQQYHHEALAVFRDLNDIEGLAATLDLLGIQSCMAAELPAAADYFRQAIALWSQAGLRRGLIYSQSSQALCSYNYQAEALATPPSTLAEAIGPPETALASAREMGWRSAEGYALFMMGSCLGAQGLYNRALACGEAGLFIAQDIDHRQWQAATHYLLGCTYLHLLAAPSALPHFEAGLALADEIKSELWRQFHAACLVRAHLALGNLAAAHELMQSRLLEAQQHNHMPGRMVLCVAAELALVEGRPAEGLAMLDRLIASGIEVTGLGPQSMPYLLYLRGKALADLREPEAAAAAWAAALAGAQTLRALPVMWRVRAALGHLYQSQGQIEQAQAEFAAARAGVWELAADMPGWEYQENFVRKATAGWPS